MTRHGFDRLAHDLEKLIADAEELMRATAAVPGDELGALRARAEASLRRLRKRVADAQSDVVDRAHATDAYVHRNPWRSMALAGGIALLAGLLVGRR